MAYSTTKTALITGASRGLGLALARALARQGWTLILNARNEEALMCAHLELARSTKVLAVAGDVAAAQTCQDLAAAARSLGGIDVLVNNASVLGASPMPRLLDFPPDALKTVFQINVIAPLALTQSLREQLRTEPRILNITSDAGVAAYEGWGGYGASKAALEQLSAVLAVEEPSWRVYWLDPGDMRTQMHQEAFPGEDISDRPLPEVSVPGILSLIDGDYPSGRYVARDVARKPAK